MPKMNIFILTMDGGLEYFLHGGPAHNIRMVSEMRKGVITDHGDLVCANFPTLY